MLNSLCGAYAAYGFSALRYTAAAIILYGVMIALQSLIAIQIMITCVYLTSNQARARAPLATHPPDFFPEPPKLVCCMLIFALLHAPSTHQLVLCPAVNGWRRMLPGRIPACVWCKRCMPLPALHQPQWRLRQLKPSFMHTRQEVQRSVLRKVP